MLLLLVLTISTPSEEPTTAVSTGPVAASTSSPVRRPPTSAKVLDFREKRAFLLVSPGILILQLPNQALWTWGVDAGIHRRFDELTLQTGAFFEHALTRVSGPDPVDGTSLSGTAHLIRFGPELRLGGGTQRLFAYAHARAGLDLFIARAASARPIQREGPSFSFHGSFGAGVMGLIGRRLLLGLEPGAEVGASSGTLGLTALRARIFAGLAF